MTFLNTVERWDAEHGIPRRADEAYLPPLHAFSRCFKDGGQIVLCLVLGFLSVLFLSSFALFLGFGFYGWLIVFVFKLFVLAVMGFEISQVFLPYHEFHQLPTYGTAHWASPLYLEGAGFARPWKDYPQSGELQLGKLPRALRRAYRFTIPAQSVLGSFIFFGAPGMGKSVLLMNYLRMWAYHKNSAIIIDPKGEIYEYCARFFRKVYRLDFMNPEQSDRWNFLLQCRDNGEYAHMMAAAIIGLEGTKQTAADPFWSEAELALLTAILLYLPLRIDHPTPPMIHQYIASRTLDELRADLGGCEKQVVRDHWGTFTKASDITQGSVFTGLAAKLHPFTIDAAKAVTAQILLPEWERGARTVNLAHLREPGVGIFIVIPEGAAARYKMPLSTFFAEAIDNLRRGEVSEQTTKVLLVVDEAAHVQIVGLKEAVGVGRGRYFAMMLFYQNIAQGYDQYGEHGFNAIIESINVKTFLPGCGHTTTKYASDLVGETTVWSHTFDDAPGTENDKTRSSEAARPLMTPAEIRQMLKFKTAFTVVETMPPVKWTFPKSVRDGLRTLPRKFGKPHILTIQEAQELTRRRQLKEAAAGGDGESDGVVSAAEVAPAMPPAERAMPEASDAVAEGVGAGERMCATTAATRGAADSMASNPRLPPRVSNSQPERAAPVTEAAASTNTPDVGESDSREITITLSPDEVVENFMRRHYDALNKDVADPDVYLHQLTGDPVRASAAMTI